MAWFLLVLVIALSTGCSDDGHMSPVSSLSSPSPFPISLSPLDGLPALAHQGRPSVAFDGTNFVVVWEENRRFTEIPAAEPPSTAANDVGVTLDPLGTLPSTSSPGVTIPVTVRCTRLSGATNRCRIFLTDDDLEVTLGSRDLRNNIFTGGTTLDVPRPVPLWILTGGPPNKNTTITVTYTNQDGIAGRTISFFVGPFTPQGIWNPLPPLDAGDTALRAVTNITESPEDVTGSTATDTPLIRVAVGGDPLPHTTNMIAVGGSENFTFFYTPSEKTPMTLTVRVEDCIDDPGPDNIPGTLDDIPCVQSSVDAASSNNLETLTFGGADMAVLIDPDQLLTSFEAGDMLSVTVRCINRSSSPSPCHVTLRDNNSSTADQVQSISTPVPAQDSADVAIPYRVPSLSTAGSLMLEAEVKACADSLCTGFLPDVHPVDNLDSKIYGSGDIFGTRVRTDGLVFPPIPISVGEGVQHSPSVACDANGGTGCLVVWEDERTFSGAGGTGPDIVGAIVSSMGTVLTAGIPISELSDFSLTQDHTVPPSCDIDVASPGLGLDTVPVEGSEVTPKVAFDGTTYLVVWEESRVVPTLIPTVYKNAGTLSVRVNATLSDGGAGGTVTNVATTPLTTAVRELTIQNIVGTLPPEAAATADGVTRGFRYSPPPGFSGSITLTLTVVANGGGGTCTPDSHGADNNDIIILKIGSSDSSSDIWGALVDPSGTIVLDQVGLPLSLPLSTASGDQERPVIACDGTGGTGCLVVWEDGRGLGTSGVNIFGTRVGVTSSTCGLFPVPCILDSNGIGVSSAQGDQLTPSVAFDGTNYLVVWADGRDIATTSRDIFGTRVDPTGVVLDPNGISIFQTQLLQENPAVAFDGTAYWVVWDDWREAPTETDIAGVRLSPSGAPLDSQVVLVSGASPNNSQIRPAIACPHPLPPPPGEGMGEGCLAVWEDWRNFSTTGPGDIFGTLLTP